MNREELEISIGAYLDGTLGEPERIALEARLASDPEAREMLREERQLTAALRVGGLPEVRWEMLAERIAGGIDEEMEARVERVSWGMRMVRSPWIMTAAASVALAVGIGLVYEMGTRGGNGGGGGVGPGAGPGPVAMVIEGPEEEKPAGAVVSEVSIGPGGTYAKAPSLAPYADEMDSRPTRVVIAAGTPVAPVSVEEAPTSPF